MKVTKYVTVDAILTDTEIIPIWDERIEYAKGKYGSKVLRINGAEFSTLQQVVLNLKTKELSKGIVLETIAENRRGFKVGDTVVYTETPNKENGVSPTKIISIEKGMVSQTCKLGKKFEPIDCFLFKNEVIDPDMLYCLNVYNQKFILESGEEIFYEHQLIKIKL